MFDNLNSDAVALVNNDDKHSIEMIANTKAKKHTYSLKTMSDFKCKILENRFDGMLLNINNYDLWTKLIGQFNAYNVLAVYAVGILLETQEEKLLEGISMLSSAEGRFQTVRNKEGVTAIIDYAHTPDALEKVLQELKKYSRLKLVFGCGGDRDKGKRKEMAEIAELLADEVVITNDNPRNESPEQIINDIELGFKNKDVEVIPDRRQAISTVISKADKGDCIVVAGKGHESYQEIKGLKHSFSDQGVVRQALLEWAE